MVERKPLTTREIEVLVPQETNAGTPLRESSARLTIPRTGLVTQAGLQMEGPYTRNW